jgi:hypothetical protein
LAERDQLAVRDYKLEKAPDVADQVAEEEEIKRILQEVGEEGIDISGTVGSGHAKNCSCDNKWDGESERCMGEGVRIRWRRGKGHHFLRPRVGTETY